MKCNTPKMDFNDPNVIREAKDFLKYIQQNPDFFPESDVTINMDIDETALSLSAYMYIAELSKKVEDGKQEEHIKLVKMRSGCNYMLDRFEKRYSNYKDRVSYSIVMMCLELIEDTMKSQGLSTI